MDIEKMDATGRTSDGRKHTASLEHAVRFAGWPTPMAGSPATETYNEAGNTDSGRKTVALVGWATPTQRDHKDGGSDLTNVPINALLGWQATLAGWATPNAIPETRGGLQTDPAKAMERRASGHMLNLDDIATLSGPPSTSSPASTGKRAALAPAFSLWLMGFSIEWARCAERATRSSRKSRRSS